MTFGRRRLFLLGALVGALAGCVPPSDAPAPKLVPTGGGPVSDTAYAGTALPPPRLVIGSSTLAALSVSTGTLKPDFAPETTRYTLSSNNALFPITVTATTADDGADLSINGHPAISGEPFTLTLQPREDLTVVITGSYAAPQTTVVVYAPPTMPTWKVTSNPATAGAEDVLLNAGSYLLRVDRAGQPLYYRLIAPWRAFDFQQHLLPGGELAYSYNAIDPNDPTHVETRLMDETFNDVATLALLPFADHGAHPCDSHDFLVLGPQHYVLMAYVRKVVDLSALNPAWSATALVYAAVVQEVDHGQVVFEWDSTAHPSLFTDSIDSNGFTGAAISDYLHLNSIQIDPLDENLILSFRHTDSVIKVDRHTGAILWTLGGASDDFGLSKAQQFSHQHFARIQADRHLVLFDNGNNVRQSRVVRFALDEALHKVTDFQVVYDKPMDQPQTNFMGSATQMDPNRFLIGWGGWEPGAVIPPSVTETVAGTPSWSLTFDAPSLFSYRALPVAK